MRKIMWKKGVSIALAAAMMAGSTSVSIPVLASQTVVNDTIQKVKAQAEDYVYVYAGLTWNEYWSAEDVYAAGNTESSDVLDDHNETDKGGYDAVSRATTNHGIHRGSFQCTTTIETEDGLSYEVAGWDQSGDTVKMILTDGSEIAFSRGVFTEEDGTTHTMKDYKVYGLKYVPVAVKADDYQAFKESHKVVENGGKLFGGYTESNLSSYEAYAAVDADTNGLKVASKNADGSFSFTARNNKGTNSGLKASADATTKTALKKVDTDKITVTPNTTSGAYGEFLRVDLTGEAYGDLGSNMQAVTWTYYGNDSTYTKALETYGTKFAADNWMHKSNGIQLGLTDSVRCQLPEGTDGTGYWRITLSALGYEDFTFDVQATSENIAGFEAADETTLSELRAEVEAAEKLNKDDYTDKSYEAMEAELEEAKELLAKDASEISKSVATEAIEHLKAAVKALVKADATVINGMVYATVNMEYADFYYGELNDLSDAGKTLDLSKDVVSEAGYRDEGMYDAVTSATQQKSKRFAATYYDENVANKETGSEATGVNINGIANVQIAIPEALYNQLMENKDKSHKVYQYLENATYSKKAFDEYKELRADGTFGKMVSKTTSSADITASITTSTAWGDYQISVKGLPEGAVTTDNMLGVVLEDENGNKYGMEHLDNLWLQTQEMSFAVTDNFKEPHGNFVPAKRYQGIGKKITKITYLLKDADDIVINTDLKLKTLNDDSVAGEAQAAAYSKKGTKVSFSFNNLPSGANYTLASLVKGTRYGTEIDASKYSYDAASKTITLDSSLLPATDYVATFVDDEYSDIKVTFAVNKGTQTISKNLAVTYGETKSLKLTGEAEGDVSYVSSNEKVATVDANGKVTIKGVGTAQITITATGSDAFDEAVEVVTLTVEKGATSVSLSNKTATYNGKTVAIGTAKVEGSTAKPVYTYYTDAACTKVASSHKNAGTYYVKATVAEDDNYVAASSNVAKLTIKKAAQTIKVSKSSANYTVAALKKASKSFSIGAKATGKVTYKVTSGSKYVTVTSAGKVTVKKNAKKGTYKVTVTAASTTNYNAATKVVTIKVK